MQNIGANNAGDAFYRYKMPKLVAKIEGRGNGIKTNVVNNVDIARALDRPPTYTLKHFGCELGAQTNYDKKTGTSIVNGAHDAKKLSEVLEIFIKKYVQCYSCGNPETVIKIRRECIFLKCKACGHTSDVDMRDKLTGFIVKNPPENKMSKAEAKVRKDEKERMKAAEKAAEKEIKAVAKEKKKKERSLSKTLDSKSSKDLNEDNNGEVGSDDAEADTNVEVDDEGDDDGTEWKTDLSEDAIAKRQREQLTSAAAALIQGSVANAEGEVVEESKSAAVEETDEGSDKEGSEELTSEERARLYIEKRSPLELASIIMNVDAPGGVVGKMKLFYAALLDGYDGRLVARMLSKHKYIYALTLDDCQQPSDSLQASQLIAIEHYLAEVQPERMAEMPFILKMLYEEDLVSDDIIIAWGAMPAVAKKHGVSKANAAKIREASQKVLEWLEAESEDEADDEDDDDE